jgi:hypothetical protein
MRTECFGDVFLGAVEGEIAEEESVTWLTDLIAIGLASVVLLLVLVGTSIGKVDVQGAAVEISTMLLTLGFGRISSIDEFDIAESVAC